MSILRPIISVIFFTTLAWFLSSEIFNNILLSPINPDFGGYKIINKLTQFVGIQTLNSSSSFSLTSREVSAHFIMILKQSFWIGLFFSCPIIFWEIYRFLKPELKLKDSLNLIFKISILFYIGAFLGYYLILPMTIRFSDFFLLDNSIQNYIDINDYLMIAFEVMFTTGFIFILPIVFRFIIAIRKKSIMPISNVSTTDNQNENIEEKPKNNPSMFTPILSILGIVRGVIYFAQDRPIVGILALTFGCVGGYFALRDRDLI